MRYLLTSAGRKALGERARQQPLVGFDFDGTLAPIIAEPARAALPPHTRALLDQVTTRFLCVVLSGRSRQDLVQRLGNLQFRQVFGNHGLEPWHTSETLFRRIRGWGELLARRLSGRPGIWLEDKGYSLSLHYRHCVNPRRARKEILGVLAELGEARIQPGKFVYNVMPDRAIHKGAVFQEAMDLYCCAHALYVGDDHTDEDVFASCNAARVMTIRVGASRTSRAAYYLRHQEEINDLLELLGQSGQTLARHYR